MTACSKITVILTPVGVVTDDIKMGLKPSAANRFNLFSSCSH
jgi:hypothetical protein